jgi:hypothetical protein
LLDRHPAVYMAKPVKPEPKFFLVDALYEQGIAHYCRTWFSDVPAGHVAGEKSTDYLESAVAAERIGRDLPAVKLIFVLREPIARAYSNYLWTRMNGLEHESFARALELEHERERTLPEHWKFTRPFSYFSRGLYADLLMPYLQRFSREQLYILKFEDIVRSPGHVATRLHAFIGVAPRGDDVEGLGVINASEKTGEALDPVVRHQLADRYREPNERLAQLLGPAFSSW